MSWGMSSFSVDRHSICTKCRGADCSVDCRCDECLSWSSEELEAYVKLRKSLASKSKGKKSSSSIKSPSAPGPSAPNVDFDDRILADFAVFSQDVDNRIASMSSSVMNRLNDLFGNIDDRFANRSLSAEPGVSGLTLPTGQSPLLRHSVSTNINPIRFQSDAGGPMPHGSGSAHPGNVGESCKGLGSNPVSAQHPQASAEALEAAHCSQTGDSDRARLQASVGHHVFVREPEDDGEEDQESVVEFPVVDKIFNKLVHYIYEQYPNSRPRSDPSVPPRCDFESYFAVADLRLSAVQGCAGTLGYRRSRLKHMNMLLN